MDINAQFRPGAWIKLPLSVLFALKPTELKVYCVIRAHRNRVTGKCFPYLGSIAEKTGLNKRHIRRIRNKLKALGILTWTGGQGRGNKCHYDFPLETASDVEQARLCAELKRGHPCPLLEKEQKGDISEHKRGSPCPVKTYPENQPETQSQKGFAPHKKGDTHVPHNYINKKKELEDDASDSAPSQPAFGEQSDTELNPKVKGIFADALAKTIFKDAYGRDAFDKHELKRVHSLMDRGLDKYQIINILKSNRNRNKEVLCTK